MSDKYILDASGEPLACNDLMTWGKWMQSGDRRVALDEIEEARVSTVFLGLDQRFENEGRPVLWETMIFGGPHDQYCDRYSTREEALAGHQRAVALAKGESVSVN